jgi:hypothetical protein
MMALCWAVLAVLALFTTTVSGAAQSMSPRKKYLAKLIALGCTNTIVNNYIVDDLVAAGGLIPTAVLTARLAQLPGVTTSDIQPVATCLSKWTN